MENHVVVDPSSLHSVETSSFCACCGITLNSTSSMYPLKIKTPKAKKLNLQQDLEFTLCPNCFSLLKKKRVSNTIKLSSLIAPILAFYILGIILVFVGPLTIAEDGSKLSAELLFIIGTVMIAIEACIIGYFKIRDNINIPNVITFTLSISIVLVFSVFFPAIIVCGILLLIGLKSPIPFTITSKPNLIFATTLIFEICMIWLVFGQIIVLIINNLYNSKFKKTLKLYPNNPQFNYFPPHEIQRFYKRLKDFKLVKIRLYSPNEKDSKYFFISASDTNRLNGKKT
ncbi:MAG: hypothetical protein ACTSYD_12090, partial [Candidatus Heimdallarchaeaceae archaeon]